VRRWLLLTLVVIACTGLAAVTTPGRPRLSDVIARRVPDGGIQPRAMLDQRGILHLLYFKGDPAGGDLYYTTSRDLGRTFSPAVRVNSTPASVLATGTMRGGQMALGRGGRVHVAWMVPTQPAVVRYTHTAAGGGGFEAERTMPTNMGDIDAPALAADPDGFVYVGWHGHAAGAPGREDSRAVWMRTSRDDGKTFEAERPAWSQPTGACGCCGLEFYAPHGGGLFVLYRAAIESVHRDMYLIESTDHGRHFAGSAVQRWDVNACPMSSMSFAGNATALFAAWETEGQVFAGAVERSLSAVPAPFSPAAGTRSRKHPRLAANGDSDVLLTWADGAGWAKGGELRYAIFDRAGRAIVDAVDIAALPVWSFGAPIAAPDGRWIVFY
jgi:hypothetical protein